MDRYDPSEIEARWRGVWEEEHTWEVSNPGRRRVGGSATACDRGAVAP